MLGYFRFFCFELITWVEFQPNMSVVPHFHHNHPNNIFVLVIQAMTPFYQQNATESINKASKIKKYNIV